MDVYERLTRAHDRHRSLARELANSTGQIERRRGLWREFHADVGAHLEFEEQVFYAALYLDPTAQRHVRRSIAEHQELAEKLGDLEELDRSSPAWIELFKALRDRLERHLRQEEEEVFPLARRLRDSAGKQAVAASGRRTLPQNRC